MYCKKARKQIYTKAIFIISIIALTSFYYSSAIAEESPWIETYRKRPLTIKIDGTNELGQLPETYKTGLWITNIVKNKFMIKKYLNDNMVGVIQITNPFPGILANSTSFEDYKEDLVKTFSQGTDAYDMLQLMKESASYIFIGHFGHPMPAWLSSNVSDIKYTNSWWYATNVTAPKCYETQCTNEKGKSVNGWSAIIEYTLQYLHGNLGLTNLGYFLGHEQDKDWIGKEIDFYKLYKYTVEAAKKVSPDIKVGGVGPMGWLSKRFPCHPAHYNYTGLNMCRNTDGWSANGNVCKNPRQHYRLSKCKPMLLNFVKYAEAKNLTVDFLNWHMFSMPPFEGNFIQITDSIKQWSNNTYSLYPADWAYWSGSLGQTHPHNNGKWYPMDAIDNEENSAYVVSNIHTMAKMGIKWHSHDFDITDKDKEKSTYIERQGEFIGDWPIFTRSGIIKPVYNALKAISIFAGKKEGQLANEISVEIPDERYIKIAASKTRDGSIFRILLSNFAPRGSLRDNNILYEFNKCMGKTEVSELNNRLILKRLVTKDHTKVFTDSTSIEKAANAFNLRDKQTKDTLKQCINLVKTLQQYDNDATTRNRFVQIKLNMPQNATYNVKKYIIDHNRSNSCTINKNSETVLSNTVCGIDGQLDREVETYEAKTQQKAIDTTSYAMQGYGFDQETVDYIVNRLNDCKNRKQSIVQCFKKFKGTGKERLIRKANRYYNSVYTNTLFEMVDEINRKQSIDLQPVYEASEEVSNNELTLRAVVTPYSVFLVEVELEN